MHQIMLNTSYPVKPYILLKTRNIKYQILDTFLVCKGPYGLLMSWAVNFNLKRGLFCFDEQLGHPHVEMSNSMPVVRLW